MSNTDEILKLKKLLDEGIITEQEFKIKKNVLLNEEIEKNKQEKKEKSNITLKNKNKKSHHTLLIFGIIFFILFIFIIIVGNSTDQQYEKVSQTKNLLEQYSISYEETDKIIRECGFTDYTIARDEEMDGYWGKGTKAFQITFKVDNEENILAGFTTKNNKINNVYYIKDELYKNGEVKNKIDYYILTNEKKYNYIDNAKEVVKKQLNYPNTAKFPWLYDEYYVTFKNNKNFTVKGKVTASNAFGVEQTYTWEVIVKKGKVTKVNMN